MPNPSAEETREIALGQQILFLKKIAFFHDFDDNELRQFLSVSKWLKVQADTEIIKEETSEKVFYILVKGKVLVFKTNPVKGETVILTTLKTGDCFGEMSLFLDTKRTAGVKTLEDSFILMVDPDIINTSNVFLQLKFYKRFCEILVSRLILANRQFVKSKAGKYFDIQSPSQGKEKFSRQQTYPREEKGNSPSEARNPSLSREIERGGESPVPRKDHNSPPLSMPPADTDKRTVVKLQQIVSSIDTQYPVNAKVARKINSFWSAEETSNTRKFADLMNLDPYLVARVLQIANSPYYRRSNIVGTIPHAMISLGMEQMVTIVKDIIESSIRVKSFGGSHPLYLSFWRHSVVVGRIAEFLKEITRANLAADVYLAGLLHDFGMLPLDAACPHFYQQLLRSQPFSAEDLVKAEIDGTGIDHGKAGFWLAEKMGLPQPYLEVMMFHHAPEKARDHHLLVALVHLADLFALQQGVSFGGNEKVDVEPIRSTGWLLIQEHHRPFLDVNVIDFIAQFSQELEKAWPRISADLEP